MTSNPLPRDFKVTFGSAGLTMELRGTVSDAGLENVEADVTPALKLVLQSLGKAEGLSGADALKQQIIEECRALPPSWIEPITKAVDEALKRKEPSS
jgi:hypothetical protein